MLKRVLALSLVGTALVLGLPAQSALADPAQAAAAHTSAPYLHAPTSDTGHGRAFH